MLDDGEQSRTFTRFDNKPSSVNHSIETLGGKKYTIHSSCSPLLPTDVPLRQVNYSKDFKQDLK